MKNKNIFLVGIGLLLVVAILFLISFVTNKGNEDKFKESYEEIETNLTNNFIYLSAGYTTEYGGIEKLFEKKETKIKDLEEQNKLTYVVMVLAKKESFEDVKEELNEKLASRIGNNEDYLLIRGETIKTSMKELLGIDWEHKSIPAKNDFAYNFEYIEEDDVYLITPNESYESNDQKTIVLSAIESKSTAKTVKTTVAIAYIEYTQNEKGNEIIRFYSDQARDNLVFEVNVDALLSDKEKEFVNETELMQEHIDDFNKYEITSREEDENFIPESIKRK